MAKKGAKKAKKINWRRLGISALENGIKKAIELVVLALLLGAAMKTVLFVVPAVVAGTVFAKIIKIHVSD
ncbi:MAG: hypothetical protein Q8O89_04200 [Nanoarchaeota archaeon]|nr:hypothetical protein [Nanoarchaeota archaeon]